MIIDSACLAGVLVIDKAIKQKFIHMKSIVLLSLGFLGVWEFQEMLLFQK
ncbi:hypothetical protein ACSMFR_02435 [Listeria aquatica]